MSLAKETFDRIKKLKRTELEEFRNFVYIEIDSMKTFEKEINFAAKYYDAARVLSKELETHGFKALLNEASLIVSVRHLDGEEK